MADSLNSCNFVEINDALMSCILIMGQLWWLSFTCFWKSLFNQKQIKYISMFIIQRLPF